MCTDAVQILRVALQNLVGQATRYSGLAHTWTIVWTLNFINCLNKDYKYKFCANIPSNNYFNDKFQNGFYYSTPTIV